MFQTSPHPSLQPPLSQAIPLIHVILLAIFLTIYLPSFSPFISRVYGHSLSVFLVCSFISILVLIAVIEF